VFTAGQGPIDPATGEVVEGSIEQLTQRTLENIEAVLASVGASRRDVVKVTAHLESFELFEGFDAAYRDFFGDALPARTTVESGLGGIQVELDAIAVVPQDGESG
jgi:enamine deaminase RidA (YjgF/YER057c/UK114 family)